MPFDQAAVFFCCRRAAVEPLLKASQNHLRMFFSRAELDQGFPPPRLVPNRRMTSAVAIAKQLNITPTTEAFSISPAIDRSNMSTESGIVEGADNKIDVLMSPTLDMNT